MNKFTTLAEDTLNDYEYKAKVATERVTEEWLTHYGCEKGTTCNGLGVIGIGLFKGDLSTARVVETLEAEAKAYALTKGVSYACQYGAVACAGALGAKALLTGEVSKEEVGQLVGSAAGTAVGCYLGPLGCVAGGIAGSALGGAIADSPLGDIAGGIYDAAGGVIDAIGDLF